MNKAVYITKCRLVTVGRIVFALPSYLVMMETRRGSEATASRRPETHAFGDIDRLNGQTSTLNPAFTSFSPLLNNKPPACMTKCNEKNEAGKHPKYVIERLIEIMRLAFAWRMKEYQLPQSPANAFFFPRCS